MATIIRDQNLIRVGKGVMPDSRKRVILPKTVVQEGVTYFVYHNSIGQIILDPQANIPASELWIFENKDVLASIDRGMLESLNGEAMERGSFAKYVKDAP
jgi:hypothetical protein